MAVAGSVDVLATALWPQGDIRDPLGIWGFRTRLTGTGDGGGMKVTVTVPAGRNAGNIYTVYSAVITQVVGTANPGSGKVRILTNWPNVDPQAGVQSYGSMRLFTMFGSTGFTAPTTGPLDVALIGPNERFLLMGDPRPTAGELTIMELEFDENVLADELSYEGYGYYWDRSVWNAPGGPRHPGSS